VLGIANSEGIVRWEGFELDVRSAELRDANGKAVRLSEQPLRILIALLERPGEVILREDLRKRLWPNDTVVEFEHSISAAMNRLRQALGDSAETAKFIETLARRGYRWKVPVEWQQPQAAPPPIGAANGNFTGKRISHYRVLELLGGGGMGVVYKAEDIKLGRRVALKFLPEELAGDEAAMRRFEREARSASALNHPNICTIHAVEEHDGELFIAMELLEGRTLRDMIAYPETPTSPGQGMPLPLKALLETAVQIAKGLEAAHQKGIIHRDIKPANIFVTNHGQVKVLDFGLAKLHEFESVEIPSPAPSDEGPKSDWNPLLTLTRTGVTIGTAAYMSPEQVRGEELDARTDLFSFGLVLYEMATSQRAFVGDTAPILHHAILNETPAPVRDLNPQFPAKLEAIVNKAIEKDREARYQTAAEMRADLEALQLGKEHSGSRWWVFGAVAIVTLSAAAASFWLARHQQQSFPPPPDLKLWQLTANSSENFVQDGRISPNGKYLAYVDLKGIHVKTIDADEARTLAQPEALKNQKVEWAFGAWFPDSARFLLNAHPAAEAEYLSELEADEDLSVWEFPLRGGTPHILRTKAWADSISPDGSLISFRAHRSRSGSREVWVMDSSGGHPHKVFENDAVGGLGWSPGSGRAWYLRSNGPELRDADFKWLSFHWEKDHIAVDSSATDITPPFGMYKTLDASVLPDGRFIYSVRDAGSIGSETCNFWTAQRDPQTDKPIGKPRQLTHWTGFCMSDISFSEDGKRLAFKAWSGHPALYVADLHAGGIGITNERHFTGSESSEVWADWTTDSKSLIFLSNRSGRPAIYKQALDSDSPELLVRPQNGLEVCCVSTDGQWLIYRIHEGPAQPSSSPEEIMRVPVAGGPSEEVFQVKRLNWWGCAQATSNLCAVAESTEDRKQAIITAFDPINGRGSELARIAIEPNRDWALALSRDAKRFAVIRGPGNPLEIRSLKGEVLQEIKIPEWRSAGPIEWAANGKGLFVPSLTLDGASLLYVRLRGEVHVIRENRGGNYSPGLPSPDGRHIATVGTEKKSNMWMMENF
jgi:eukaryotic-like serine/threonine-protein kinase